jgi:hypothetical protein
MTSWPFAGRNCRYRSRRYLVTVGATTPPSRIGHDVGVELCDECHFSYDALDAGAVPGAIRSLGNRFAMRLSNERGDPTLALTIRTRPAPGIWSALEYACHVRDVFLVQRERVYLTAVEQCPSFARMYRDERAELARYAAQAPNEVGYELKTAAEMLAWALAGLDEAQLQRPCIYNFPEPVERTVLWLGRHAVHEGEHHLRDIDAALRSAVAASDLRSQPT